MSCEENQEVSEVDELLTGADDKVELRNQAQYDAEYLYRQAMQNEQKARAKKITNIFSNYVQQQKDRYNYKERVKRKMVRGLMALVVVIFIAVLVLSRVFILRAEIDTTGVVALVGAWITGLGSIVSILLIVVRYLFPEDEDKNFNDLVTSIIENDTKRIKDDNDFQINKK